MIRDFRRKYDGVDRQDVENDTLYCMSLMRHFGAPTRLLDWTYSPSVAAYFALEKWHPISKPVVVVWCLSDKWCEESFKQAYPDLKEKLDKYQATHWRNDSNPYIRKKKNILFEELFMNDVYNYVFPVNPFHLHERLNVQQGVFLCPGSISIPLVEILMHLNESDIKTSMRQPIRKLLCDIQDTNQWLDALDELHQSNISRESLFPGYDGFAYSLQYRLRYYDQLIESWKKSRRRHRLTK